MATRQAPDASGPPRDARWKWLLVTACGIGLVVVTLPGVDENDGVILALKTWHKPVDPHRYESAVREALAFPILARGRLLGILLLGERSSGETYAPDDIEALSQFAHGIGSALGALSRDSGRAEARFLKVQESVLDQLRTITAILRDPPHPT